MSPAEASKASRKPSRLLNRAEPASSRLFESFGHSPGAAWCDYQWRYRLVVGNPQEKLRCQQLRSQSKSKTGITMLYIHEGSS